MYRTDITVREMILLDGGTEKPKKTEEQKAKEAEQNQDISVEDLPF